MSNSQTQLAICTYNIRGFNSLKIDYIAELLKKYCIIFIVEHWLSDDQLGNISHYFPGFSLYGVSALDSTVLLQGRPHGGCLVIYPDNLGGGVKYINSKVKTIMCT